MFTYVHPGTDIIGFFSALAKCNKQKYIFEKVLIANKYRAWEGSSNYILSEFQKRTCLVFPKELEVKFDFGFIQGDIFYDYNNVEECLKTVDIVLMVRTLITDQEHFKVSSALSKVVQLLKPGAMLFLVDRKSNSDVFTQLNNYGDFIFGPVNVKCKLEHDFPNSMKNVFGSLPLIAGQGHFAVWQKDLINKGILTLSPLYNKCSKINFSSSSSSLPTESEPVDNFNIEVFADEYASKIMEEVQEIVIGLYVHYHKYCCSKEKLSNPVKINNTCQTFECRVTNSDQVDSIINQNQVEIPETIPSNFCLDSVLKSECFQNEKGDGCGNVNFTQNNQICTQIQSKVAATLPKKKCCSKQKRKKNKNLNNQEQSLNNEFCDKQIKKLSIPTDAISVNETLKNIGNKFNYKEHDCSIVEEKNTYIDENSTKFRMNSQTDIPAGRFATSETQTENETDKDKYDAMKLLTLRFKSLNEAMEQFFLNINANCCNKHKCSSHQTCCVQKNPNSSVDCATSNISNHNTCSMSQTSNQYDIHNFHYCPNDQKPTAMNINAASRSEFISTCNVHSHNSAQPLIEPCIILPLHNLNRHSISNLLSLV